MRLAVTNSSATIARSLHIDGMHHHWTHLAANVIGLPLGAGIVMTFLDKNSHGLAQKTIWMESANDK